MCTSTWPTVDSAHTRARPEVHGPECRAKPRSTGARTFHPAAVIVDEVGPRGTRPRAGSLESLMPPSHVTTHPRGGGRVTLGISARQASRPQQTRGRATPIGEATGIGEGNWLRRGMNDGKNAGDACVRFATPREQLRQRVVRQRKGQTGRDRG